MPTPSRARLATLASAALLTVLPVTLLAQPAPAAPAALAGSASTTSSTAASTSGTAERASAPGTPVALETKVVQRRPDIAVTWEEPYYTGGSALTGYTITVREGGSTLGTDTVDAATTTWTADGDALGLVLGRTYTIEVAATNGVGTGVAASTTQQLHISAYTPTLAANPTNPLAGVDWGVYTGRMDPVTNFWVDWTQQRQDATAVLAMQPKPKFFVRNYSPSEVTVAVRRYIDEMQGGDPEVMAQLSTFAMKPWETDLCANYPNGPSKAQRRSYRAYIDGVARGIGDSKVMVIIQPDGPFARCDFFDNFPGYKKSLVNSRLIRYTAKTFGALPNTTAYIEMGSADWFRWFKPHSPSRKIKEPVQMLMDGGIQYVRGFALSSSHQDSVERQIQYGRQMIRMMARKDPSLAGKHFVIDTSDNGQAFSGEAFQAKYNGKRLLHDANICTTRSQKVCVALGIPPTTDVANSRWRLCRNQWATAQVSSEMFSCAGNGPKRITRFAKKYVDAYIWLARPWLKSYGSAYSTITYDRAADLQRVWRFPTYW